MAKKTSKKPIPFESAAEKLETIVAELESGDLTLGDSLARYEEGRTLIRRCYELLESAERRIEELIEDENGRIEERPFESPEDSATPETET